MKAKEVYNVSAYKYVHVNTWYSWWTTHIITNGCSMHEYDL